MKDNFSMLKIKLKPGFLLFFAAAALFFASCSGSGKQANSSGQEENTSAQKSAEPVEINREAKLLLDYLVEMGDYVNSQNFPSMIKASSVYEELDGNIKIIDLRNAETFAKGHIKGAVNVAFSDLPDFFSNDIKPFEFDKIVMACYSGQVASYATSLLRLMGYGNVYSLRWGMSSWNKDFAKDWWMVHVSDEFEDQMELTVNEKAEADDFPVMNTGKSTGEEIMDVQIKSLFEAGFSDALISAEKVFENPGNFYIINYERKDKYEDGHIPGAIRYKPKGTLGIETEMQTIPSDKEVVTYCATGHNSGFVTAYLRLFGYDAKTLTYGNNGFMHNRMLEKQTTLSWQPFTEADVENYPYVK